jgi:hypothetical protein
VARLIWLALADGVTNRVSVAGSRRSLMTRTRHQAERKPKISKGSVCPRFLKRLNMLPLARRSHPNVNRKESSFTVCSSVDSEYEIRTKYKHNEHGRLRMTDLFRDIAAFASIATFLASLSLFMMAM